LIVDQIDDASSVDENRGEHLEDPSTSPVWRSAGKEPLIDQHVFGDDRGGRGEIKA
jgi:hypothetical protein